MLFNSLTFVAFFAIVLVLWYAIEPWRPRKAMLLVASYVFYAAWNPPFILILWLSTLVDWFVARWLYRAQRPSRRRLILLVSLIVNLGLLGYFKYGGFLVENFGIAARAIGLDFHPARPDIVLPIGISFYTFETISYTIDVYLGRCKPFRSFLDYGLFLTFFPHLVAGPILRPDEIVPQFERPHRATPKAMGFGLFLLTLGLFEKTVLADSIFAPTADAIFGTLVPLGALDAWAGILAFTGQIFCDFAGYSTCAIGAAICFGFSLPDNFRFPYAAIGFSDFWRRWHISLSRWLRDYLYVPLGGNRNGAARTQINLMLTMLIGGLWHGASWNFVIWGGIHGFYLLGERLVRRFGPGGPWLETAPARGGLMLLTFLLTCITWVFFRAKELSGATSLLAAAFGAGGGAAVLPTQELIAVGIAIVGLVAVHWRMRDRSLEDWAAGVSDNALVGLWTVMAFSIVLTQGGGDAFIYFQF
ncbi:MAG TPA: MBOAT family O-acyltransferase [Kofleriaceae bacterium]|nr:MBOAT family O-acyltransferase [Kofleriaceae bacterium]